MTAWPVQKEFIVKLILMNAPVTHAINWAKVPYYAKLRHFLLLLVISIYSNAFAIPHGLEIYAKLKLMLVNRVLV